MRDRFHCRRLPAVLEALERSECLEPAELADHARVCTECRAATLEAVSHSLTAALRAGDPADTVASERDDALRRRIGAALASELPAQPQSGVRMRRARLAWPLPAAAAVCLLLTWWGRREAAIPGQVDSGANSIRAGSNSIPEGVVSPLPRPSVPRHDARAPAGFPRRVRERAERSVGGGPSRTTVKSNPPLATARTDRREHRTGRRGPVRLAARPIGKQPEGTELPRRRVIQIDGPLRPEPVPPRAEPTILLGAGKIEESSYGVAFTGPPDAASTNEKRSDR
jgi:hypothetical protein